MTIHDVLMAIRQRWWALVGCIVLGGVIGVGAAAIPAATYTSSASVVVAVPDVEQNSLQLPGGLSVAQRAVNYQTLATGPEVLGSVIKKLGLDSTISELTAEVKVDVPLGTTLVQITASANSAHGAQELAQGIAQELSDTANKLEAALGVSQPKAVLSVADPATLPLKPNASGTVKKGALGVIAGLIVGAGVLWLLEFLDGSVRKPEDVATVTGAPVLGTIGRADSAVPATGAAAERLRTIRTALTARDGADFLVVSDVATSGPAARVAANLAASYARAGHRTLLVDADFVGAAATGAVGLRRGPGLAEALASGTVAAGSITAWSAGGVDVLTPGAASDGHDDLLTPARLSTVFGELRSSYDVVIVAAPPALASVAAATVGAAAGAVVLVAAWGVTTLAASSHARDRVTMASARLAGTVIADVPAFRMRTDADFVPARA